MNNNDKNSFAQPAVFELRLESLLPHCKSIRDGLYGDKPTNFGIQEMGIAHAVGKARTLASEVKMEMDSLSTMLDKL